jgi:hypothetical protein
MTLLTTELIFFNDIDHGYLGFFFLKKNSKLEIKKIQAIDTGGFLVFLSFFFC